MRINSLEDTEKVVSEIEVYLIFNRSVEEIGIVEKKQENFFEVSYEGIHSETTYLGLTKQELREFLLCNARFLNTGYTCVKMI